MFHDTTACIGSGQGACFSSLFGLYCAIWNSIIPPLQSPQIIMHHAFFFISLLYRYSMKIARSRVQLVLNISASSATIVISYTKTSKSRALRHPQHCNMPMDTYITVAVKLIAICDEVVFSLIVAFIVNCNDSYRINCVSCAKLLLTVAHGRQKNNSTEAPCPKVKCD